MISFNPQLVEELKNRYKDAIEDLYVQVDVVRGLQNYPSTKAKHIFDFKDGIRLIISKEKEPSGRIVIHISGIGISVTDGIPLLMNDVVLWHCVEHFKLLSGSDKELELKAISNEHVAHMYLRLDN